MPQKHPDLKKILFIEDDPDQVFLYQTQFQNYPELDLQPVYSGQEGLQKAQEEKPDLILLDLLLTDIYGLEVLKELKQNPATQDIPVIVITNMFKTSISKECIKQGAEDYWLKTEMMPRQIVESVKKRLN